MSTEGHHPRQCLLLCWGDVFVSVHAVKNIVLAGLRQSLQWKLWGSLECSRNVIAPLQITAHHLLMSAQPGFQAEGVTALQREVRVHPAEAYQASFSLISLGNNVSEDVIE